MSRFCTAAYFPIIGSVAPITDHMPLKVRNHLKTHIYDSKQLIYCNYLTKTIANMNETFSSQCSFICQLSCWILSVVIYNLESMLSNDCTD